MRTLDKCVTISDKDYSKFTLLVSVSFLSGICLAIGILSFPAGWDNDHVRGICGPHSADYGLGDCGVRWVDRLYRAGPKSGP